MKRYLTELGEDRIIRGLEKSFAPKNPRVIKGIGDDTSVTAQDGGKLLLSTTDTLIEGTHFDLSYAPPGLLGKKALSISLSDIAAMGGEPLFFLVSIALTPKTKKEFIDALYRGIKEISEEFKVALAGGNTARAGLTMISTTVIGEVPKGKAVYRSGAREGHAIFVTGTPGDSALGLKVLQNHGYRAAVKGRFGKAVSRHLAPVPRMEAGSLLAKKGIARSMIDISDGVALDLKRVCVESNAGAEIYLKDFPVSAELKEYAERVKDRSWIDLALSGGEDYELLFTAPEADKKKISRLAERLKIRITPIGRITGKGLKILDENGRPMKLKRLGFEHF
ncbi:MAG: thiamine-phosphate kinase [Deltaproteobacteria bacterium]|nr:thiamine-phosphate kinase [Deltaproteobacteria bacterium]